MPGDGKFFLQLHLPAGELLRQRTALVHWQRIMARQVRCGLVVRICGSRVARPSAADANPRPIGCRAA